MDTTTYTLPMLAVSAIIPKLFNNQFLSDIYFSVESKVIHAHCFVLMCRSGLFHKILLKSNGDKEHVITINEYKYETFYQFVKFIYTDKCTLHKFDIALDLLQLSIEYEIVTLENCVVTNITTRTLTNAERIKLFEFRESKGEDLYRRFPWVQDCVAPYAYELFESNIFLRISPNAMENILKWSFIGRKEKQFREFDIFNILVNWLFKYSEENKIEMIERRKLFDRMKIFIRFPIMAEFEFRECMRKTDELLEASDFFYMPRVDDTFYFKALNAIPRKPYTKSKDCKWMARCYAVQEEIPTYMSPIGTKLIALHIISYYPIWSVTLRVDPPGDLRFPMCFTFKDKKFRKYICLGDSIRIYQNCNYFISINVIKEELTTDGPTEDITNTFDKSFYTKRSIIHGYEIETYFKK